MTKQSPVEVRAKSAAESRRRWPEKARARNAVQRAIRSGKLTRPTECEGCRKAGAVEASHGDYAKPLDVKWLCRKCHIERDAPSTCLRGHVLAGDNLYPADKYTGAHRACRACRRERYQEMKNRERQEADSERE